MGNGTLLTMIARFLLHGGYRAIFMSQKKLFQLCHFISQQGDFILEVKGKTFSLETNGRSSQSSQKSANIHTASWCFSEELCSVQYNFISAFTEYDFTKCIYFFTNRKSIYTYTESSSTHEKLGAKTAATPPTCQSIFEGELLSLAIYFYFNVVLMWSFFFFK